jgi:RHH-type proline utilization regulon transcriptional repressor/proline dehydrogenase/delta 1-pyrroline-5-carboxylate dehydrogenase
VGSALLAGNSLALLVDAASAPAARTLVQALQQAGVPAQALQLGEGLDGLDAWLASEALAGVVLAGGDAAQAGALQRQLAQRRGAILPLIAVDEACCPRQLYRFAAEQTLTINTAAAGGNAALLAGGH